MTVKYIKLNKLLKLNPREFVSRVTEPDASGRYEEKWRVGDNIYIVPRTIF